MVLGHGAGFGTYRFVRLDVLGRGGSQGDCEDRGRVEWIPSGEEGWIKGLV